jgi:ferredoxin
MKVWLDKELCTGCGLCPEIAESVFTLYDDGLAYVQDEMGQRLESGTLADVPQYLEDAVEEAADECPASCIYVVNG